MCGGEQVRSDSRTAVPQLEWNKVSAELETASASEIILWAVRRFGGGLVLASSFQDAVLIDLTVKVAGDIEVLFLDTQYHFPETLEFVGRVAAEYDLNLKMVAPLVGPDDLWKVDVNSCCAMRKVEPLRRALANKTAWMTGLRRAEAPTRSNAAIVDFDHTLQVAKVNPIARWSDDDVAQYCADHGLPVHPLRHEGYRSVGCWPCTVPVAAGDDARAGRWPGTPKSECGIHSGSGR